MRAHTNAKTEQAIAEIQAFHAMGLRSLRELPRGKNYGRAREQAEAEGVHVAILQRSRQLADPETGYSDDELAGLYALMRERGATIKPHLLIRLLTLPRGERRRLERMACKGDWKKSKLDNELRARRGLVAGRPGRPPWLEGGDADSVRFALLRAAEKWTRLSAAARSAPAYSSLGADFTAALAKADACMASLLGDFVGEDGAFRRK